MRASRTARSNLPGRCEARGEQQHEPGHDELAEERERDEGKRQSGEGLLGEGAGPLLPPSP